MVYVRVHPEQALEDGLDEVTEIRRERSAWLHCVTISEEIYTG
jgi:hypothetical protein